MKIKEFVMANLNKKEEERLTSKDAMCLAGIEKEISTIQMLKWERKFAKGPFEGYFATYGNSIVSRSFGEFPVKADELFDIFLDENTMKKVDPTLDVFTILGMLEGGVTISRMQKKGMFPMKKRDFACASYWKKEGDTYYNYCRSVKTVPLDPNYVRGNIYVAFNKITPSENGCKMEMIGQFDMGGSVPGFINRWISKMSSKQALILKEKLFGKK